MASRPRRPRTSSLVAYRIADARHPIFDGTGASLIGGRWNSPGRPVIYAALSYAGTMLERLVQAGTGRVPRNEKSVRITIPGRVSREEWSLESLPLGWNSADNIASRELGDRWLESRRSAVLIVPSVVAIHESNIVINPAHPDCKWIVASEPEDVIWDERLFERGKI